VSLLTSDRGWSGDTQSARWHSTGGLTGCIELGQPMVPHACTGKGFWQHSVDRPPPALRSTISAGSQPTAIHSPNVPPSWPPTLHAGRRSRWHSAPSTWRLCLCSPSLGRCAAPCWACRTCKSRWCSSGRCVLCCAMLCCAMPCCGMLCCAVLGSHLQGLEVLQYGVLLQQGLLASCAATDAHTGSHWRAPRVWWHLPLCRAAW